MHRLVGRDERVVGLKTGTTLIGGYNLVMKAYDEAVKEGYRFGCYGDAMLIL